MEATHPPNELAQRIAATLEPLIRTALAEYGVPGLALGLVKDDALVYAQGFGVRSVATGEPVTPASVFHLASISKPFVATAIMQLAEAGRLELDAPVVTYLPYFRLADDGAAAITLTQLLAHTAGMPDVEDYLWYRPEHDDGALERYVRSLATKALIAAPGERYAYSNAGFEVLGDVVAKVSGLNFEDYLKTNVLAPLGMRTSTFVRSAVPPELATTPHFGLPATVVVDAYPYNRAHAPSSTLHASIVELCRWARANLRHGTLEGRRILYGESYGTLWRARAATGDDGWQEATALGWFVGTFRGRRVVSHDGHDPGFETRLVLLPDENLAVVVLANCNTAPIGAITDAALDVLLGRAPQAPPPSVAVPVAAALATQGRAAAVARYQQLTQQPEAYDARPSRFGDAVWGALDVHRPEAVRPLLELWVTLQPDAIEAHEMLDWADDVDGSSEHHR